MLAGAAAGYGGDSRRPVIGFCLTAITALQAICAAALMTAHRDGRQKRANHPLALRRASARTAGTPNARVRTSVSPL